MLDKNEAISSSPSIAAAPISPAAPAASAEPVTSTKPAGMRLPAWVLVLLLGLAVAGLVLSLLLWQRVGQLQTDVAHRSAQSNTQSIEARTLSQQAQTLALDQAARLGSVENQVKDLGLQRARLEALVTQITRTQDDNLLVEINGAVRLAQQQMDLTGSTEPMLTALRRARQRLDQASLPQLGNLQRAINADVERLQGASMVDGLAIQRRLDELQRQIDDLTLRNDVAQWSAPAAPAQAATPATTTAVSNWQQWWQSVWADLRQLVRVSRVDRPESILIAPDQAYFLRENLKLRLLHARVDLASRQYARVRSELTLVANEVERYFEPTARSTQQLLVALGQIQAQVHDVHMPEITETLTALAAVSQP